MSRGSSDGNGRARHGAPVVPDHEIVLPPFVVIDELALRREFGKISQQRQCFRARPAKDIARMRR